MIQLGVDVMKKILSLIVILLMFVPIPIQGAKKATSIEAYSQGKEVKGDVLAKDVTLSDDLKGTMIASNEGLEFINNDDFMINIDHPVKRFEVIDDLDNDGIRDVAVYLKTRSGYSNFQIISSKNSKVIYETALTHKTIDENNNVIIENSIIRQILSSDKIIYLIYDHHLLAVDANKKEIIFDYEDADNIWKMVIVDNQIIFTTQQGQVVSIDKKSGDENYRTTVTKPLDVEVRYQNGEKQEVNMNVWDVLTLDDKLYVSSEIDKLYQLDINTGEVIKELELGVVNQDKISKRLTEQSRYNYSEGRTVVFATGVFSKAFNGYKMEMIKDDLMLVEAYLGDHDRYQVADFEEDNKGIEPSLLLVDTKNLEVKSKIKIEQFNLDSSNAVFSTYQEKEVLIIPSSVNKGTLRVSVYSLDGKLIVQNDLKNLGIGLENVKINISNYGNDYLLQINDGSSYILHNDLKTISSLGSSKIVNKIADLDQGMLVSSNQDGKINAILKLGLNGKDDILMQVNVPNEYLNNGFEAINYNDESNEILTLVNEKNNSNEIVASHILIINVNDGNIICDKKILIDNDLDGKNKYLIGDEISYFSDLNNDGKKEILVDNSIIDGSSYTYKSRYEQLVEDNGTVIDAGDLNNDGISDLVSVGETEMRVYYSNKNGYEITYQRSNLVKKYDKNLLNNQYVRVIGDLDHKGINLFVINSRNNNGCQYYQVIDPKDLSVRFNLMEEGVFDWGESFTLTEIDYNNDGINDILFNAPENKQRILSGKDGTVIAEIKRESEEYGRESSPTVLEDIVPINIDDNGQSVYQLEDINGDNVRELGYIYFDYSQNENYVKVRILDGKSLEELKICDLDNLKFSDFVIVPVRGQNKIIIKGNENNQIYDYENEVLVAGCNIAAINARGLNNGQILIEDNGKQLYAFNDQCDFKLVDFKQEKFDTGNITIKYQSEKSGMMSVYDQGSLIATSTEEKIDLKLLQGKHRLVFSYDDGQGKVTHITKEIQVNKSSITKYIIILLSLMIVLAGVLIVVYPKYRLEKKAGVRHGKNN